MILGQYLAAKLFQQLLILLVAHVLLPPPAGGDEAAAVGVWDVVKATVVCVDGGGCNAHNGQANP